MNALKFFLILAASFIACEASAVNKLPLKPDGANDAPATVYGSPNNGVSFGKTTAPSAVIDAVGSIKATGNIIGQSSVTASAFFGNGAGLTAVGAATASALAADPADCSLPNVALGINAAGTAQCSQPSNVSGTAANVTGTVAVANGGTGGTTASSARSNLAALSNAGDSATGLYTFSASSVTIKATDSASQASSGDSTSMVTIIRDEPNTSPISTDTIKLGLPSNQFRSDSHGVGLWMNHVASDTGSPLSFFRGSVAGGSVGLETATPGGAGVQFDLRGHSGSAFTGSRARVTLAATSLWGSNDNPTNITLWTTPDGSGTIAQRMIVTDAGRVGIGVADPASKLHMSSGTITLDGSGAPATGGALCLNASGAMSKCTTVVDVSGNCTCP